MTTAAGDPHRAALAMLRSGRGVPVHADAFGRMASRWGLLRDQLGAYRFRLEQTGGQHDKADLIQDVADAAAACDLLVRSGLPYDRPPEQPRFAVAYREPADWFHTIERQIWETLPGVTDEDIVARVEAIHQAGVEKLYELDSTSVVVPELDDSTMPDPHYRSESRLQTYYDPEISQLMLADLVGDQGPEIAARLLDSTYPRQQSSAAVAGQEGDRRYSPPGPSGGRSGREGGR